MRKSRASGPHRERVDAAGRQRQRSGVTMLIGDVVRRPGVKASALRYHEEQELLGASRTVGGRAR